VYILCDQIMVITVTHTLDTCCKVSDVFFCNPFRVTDDEASCMLSCVHRQCLDDIIMAFSKFVHLLDVLQ